MKTIIVNGAVWGDEGKGKLISFLSKDSDITIRCNGGSNARHKIIHNEKEYTLRLVPCGIFNNNKAVVTGNVVINPLSLNIDLQPCEETLGSLLGRLFIDENCHVTFPEHVELNIKLNSVMGTTCQGVGPTNADRLQRVGISLKRYYKGDLGKFLPLSSEEDGILQNIKKYVVNTAQLLAEERQKNPNLTVLIEGSQAFMLDNLYGTYPYVTSSATSASGLLHGAGLPMNSVSRNIAVIGAYLTRSINEPLLTRMPADKEKIVREKGREYIIQVERYRDCFWLDLVPIRYAQSINGYTEICVNKLDVLSGFDEIPVCVGYKHKGRIFETVYSWSDIEEINYEPCYKYLKGWKKDISGIKDFNKLPVEAKDYLHFIEDHISFPIKFIGTGPGPNDIIEI